MAKRGTKRVLEYARLAMGFASVQAGTRVRMLVLVQAGPSPLLRGITLLENVTTIPGFALGCGIQGGVSF